MTETAGESPFENTSCKIAIFASGAGSNAKKIIEHFSRHHKASIALVVCNKPEAGVIHIATDARIPVVMIEREHFFRGDAYVDIFKDYGINLIVLAGFLWKIPKALIGAYPDKIINIHPALLPKYGGKGMYGHFVHEAVIAGKEKESGITIHFVNENFDEGKHLFQASCPVLPTDTPDSLASRIHELEHKHFASVIESII